MRIPDHVEKGNVQIPGVKRHLKDEIVNLRINFVSHLKKILKWKSALQKDMIQISIYCCKANYKTVIKALGPHKNLAGLSIYWFYVAVAFKLISTQKSPGTAEGIEI